MASQSYGNPIHGSRIERDHNISELMRGLATTRQTVVTAKHQKSTLMYARLDNFRAFHADPLAKAMLVGLEVIPLAYRASKHTFLIHVFDFPFTGSAN
jgi:hypothetical protein